MDSYNPETGEVATVPGMPPAIAAAIVAVKKQVKQLGGDERNEHAKYNYVSVDKFYERIGKMMAEAGLAVLMDEVSSEVRASDKTGNPWLFVQYDLRFMHESGAVAAPLHRSLALPINGPQTYGAAQSYIEKQFLRQVFKVPTGEKDADETAQNPEDAPAGRSGGRTAQEAPRGGQSYPPRQQPAPAPSAATDDARKRYAEIRDEIDAAMTIPAPAGLDGIDGSQAWGAMERAIRAAEGDAKADQVIEQLRRRIANRRDMIEAQAKEVTY